MFIGSTLLGFKTRKVPNNGIFVSRITCTPYSYIFTNDGQTTNLNVVDKYARIRGIINGFNKQRIESVIDGLTIKNKGVTRSENTFSLVW